jgi:hypothetical protein
MLKYAQAAILLALVGLGAQAAQADTLQMTAAPASRAGVPSRGLTMADIERQYGAPSSRLDAVGQPPITRWVYPGFVVFFEGNRVIHAVATSGNPPAR